MEKNKLLLYNIHLYLQNVENYNVTFPSSVPLFSTAFLQLLCGQQNVQPLLLSSPDTRNPITDWLIWESLIQKSNYVQNPNNSNRTQTHDLSLELSLFTLTYLYIVMNIIFYFYDTKIRLWRSKV